MDLSSKHTTPAALRSRGDRFRDHSNHDRRKIIGKRIAGPLSGNCTIACWPCGRSQVDRSGDHSNHDRRKIVGKRTAKGHSPGSCTRPVGLAIGLKASDSVTTQITIGEK